MSYKCDICSAEMADRSRGIEYKDDDVLLCPGYWLFMAEKQKSFIELFGKAAAKNSYKMLIQQLLNSRSGFVVCINCVGMLSGTNYQLEKLGLKELFDSSESRVDKILFVAGQAWEEVHGNKRSCIAPKEQTVNDSSLKVAQKCNESIFRSKRVMIVMPIFALYMIYILFFGEIADDITLTKKIGIFVISVIVVIFGASAETGRPIIGSNKNTKK